MIIKRSCCYGRTAALAAFSASGIKIVDPVESEEIAASQQEGINYYSDEGGKQVCWRVAKRHGGFLQDGADCVNRFYSFIISSPLFKGVGIASRSDVKPLPPDPMDPTTSRFITKLTSKLTHKEVLDLEVSAYRAAAEAEAAAKAAAERAALAAAKKLSDSKWIPVIRALYESMLVATMGPGWAPKATDLEAAANEAWGLSQDGYSEQQILTFFIRKFESWGGKLTTPPPPPPPPSNPGGATAPVNQQKSSAVGLGAGALALFFLLR